MLQRTSNASVTVGYRTIGKIKDGVVILLGIKRGDSTKDAKFLAQKISRFRMFNDKGNKMSLSLVDISGEALVVSQFTLCADTKRGRRPNFMNAESPELSRVLYKKFKSCLVDEGIKVESGEFGSLMNVKLINDGPVTFVLDSAE